MRFEGKLDKWNDDRGFGFITPTRGGDPVFVHISAFPRDGQRPALGESLSFEVEPAKDGKRRAVNVERPGRARRVERSAPVPVQYRTPHRGREPRARGGRSLGIVLALLLVGGGSAYNHFKDSLPGRAPAAVMDASPAPVFRCDGRQHCSQMTSCDEAKFFLKNCPDPRMDGDHDGIPCEDTVCKGVIWR
jgi:cold shock CspA family protein